MILLAALLLASSAVHAQPALARRGDCGWVHGRVTVGAGSRQPRIWVVGTHHLLSIGADNDENAPMPGLWPFMQRQHFDPRNPRPIFGDFYVCARKRRLPEHMQQVDLKRSKNLLIVRP